MFYLIDPTIDHFKGNRDAIAYIETYVNRWDSIKPVLPDNLFDQTLQGRTNHNKTLILNKKKKIGISAATKKYYIPQYKKFFELIWTRGVDETVGLYNHHHDAAGVQNDLMRPNMVLLIYVNHKQWKDTSYGTKKKPMPVFVHRIILGDGIEERNKNALRQDSFFPGEIMVHLYFPPKAVQRMYNTSDSINCKFVEYCLRYLLPEDELERLSEEE